MPRLFVSLAGNIGAGKSTAAQILANHFDFALYQEPVLENRFLENYYEDMSRWSFTLQMEFLLKRIEHHLQIQRNDGPCIQDRSLIEDPEIFAKYLHGLGHMTDQELDLYFDFFQRFNTQIEQPDKVILLHTPDVNVLMRRISKRGRQEESTITPEFLRGLNGYYDSFGQVAEGKYEIDVLKIDVTDRDFREGRQKERFIREVGDFIKDSAPSSVELPLPSIDDSPVDADSTRQ
jgi:deoxyadenosine/deoxycytidine kinase